MLSDGASENDFFKISSFFDEGLWRIAMCSADDVLFDDGAGVEFGGDVVARCADDLDASCPCLVIWLCADECGQK